MAERVCPQSFTERSRVPAGRGSASVPSCAARGLCPTAPIKGRLKGKVRQKGKRRTPIVRFSRNNLVLLNICPRAVSSLCPTGCERPLVSLRGSWFSSWPHVLPRAAHRVKPRPSPNSYSVLTGLTLQTASFWLLVQIPTHGQRQWIVVKKEKPGQKVLHQPFYSSLISLSLGTHCICYWRNYGRAAHSTDS